jgi:hypothetical protein
MRFAHEFMLIFKQSRNEAPTKISLYESYSTGPSILQGLKTLSAHHMLIIYSNLCP